MLHELNPRHGTLHLTLNNLCFRFRAVTDMFTAQLTWQRNSFDYSLVCDAEQQYSVFFVSSHRFYLFKVFLPFRDMLYLGTTHGAGLLFIYVLTIYWSLSQQFGAGYSEISYCSAGMADLLQPSSVYYPILSLSTVLLPLWIASVPVQ